MCATVLVSFGSALPSIRSFFPCAVMRTVRAPREAGSVVSSTRPARSTRFGGSSATPCETIVRAKSTGSPPAPRSGSSATRVKGLEYRERVSVKLRAVAGREIAYRRLVAKDLARLGEIDRTERIEALYVQHGSRLEERAGDFSARAWFSDGEGEHSVAQQRAECEAYLAAGGLALGAFAEGRLVGIGIVKPQIRPGIAQLAFLHVSDGYRAAGIGRHLSDELERLAREHGAETMVVSATPSLNTVRFYLGRGFAPMSEPLPELYELEPDDVHLHKRL